MKIKSRQQENSEMTRCALLEAAQYLFVNQCYYDVSIDEISRYARVTKGAFYHHFSNKKALLKECYILQVKDIVKKIEAIPENENKWVELEAIFSLSIDHIYQHKNMLLPLQEVISILGWKEWDKIDAQILIPRFQQCVKTLFDNKEITAYSPIIVVDLIYGFVTHIAINIIKNETSFPDEAQEEFKMIFSDFLKGIKNNKNKASSEIQ